MTAGIPGAGIGGLFYLLGAVAMPFRVAVLWLLGRRDGLRGRDALRQGLLAAGILGGLWVAGWLLALVIGPEHLPHAQSDQGGLGPTSANVVRVAALFAGFLTLGTVLGAVQVARLVVRRPPPPR